MHLLQLRPDKPDYWTPSVNENPEVSFDLTGPDGSASLVKSVKVKYLITESISITHLHCL